MMTDETISQVETELKLLWPYLRDKSRDDSNDLTKTLVNQEWHNHSLPCLRATAIRQGLSPEQYRNNLVQARWTIESLFNALHQTGTFEADYREPRYVWMHQYIDIFKANDAKRGFEIDKSELLQVVAQYLSHPEIRTDWLDWQFLDSLVFQELDAYLYNVLHTRGGTGINWAAAFAGNNPVKYYGLQIAFGIVGFVLAYLAFPALAVFLLIEGHGIWALVVVGLWACNLILKIIGLVPNQYAAGRDTHAFGVQTA